MRKECQVCGGPIVNGRCKLCGMPYRNHEILYHLNENRRDHYKHASWRARIMMEDEERPLGDKKIQQYPQAGQKRSTPATGTGARVSGAAKSNMANTQARAAGRSVGSYPASGRNNAAAGRSQGAYQTVRGNAQPAAGTINREKKRRRGSVIWFMALIILISVVPAVFEEFKDRTDSVYQETYDNPTEDSWEEGDTVITLTGDDLLMVGTDLEAGSYIFTVTKGYANIRVEHNGHSAMYGLAQDNERKFYLSEGDMIWLEPSSQDTDTENAEVEIQGI